MTDHELQLQHEESAIISGPMELFSD